MAATSPTPAANISNAGCIVELINVLSYVADHADANAVVCHCLPLLRAQQESLKPCGWRVGGSEHRFT